MNHIPFDAVAAFALAVFCVFYTALVEVVNAKFPGHNQTYFFVCLGVGAVLLATVPSHGLESMVGSLLYFIVGGVIMGGGSKITAFYMRWKTEKELFNGKEDSAA